MAVLLLLLLWGSFLTGHVSSSRAWRWCKWSSSISSKLGKDRRVSVHCGGVVCPLLLKKTSESCRQEVQHCEASKRAMRAKRRAQAGTSHDDDDVDWCMANPHSLARVLFITPYCKKGKELCISRVRLATSVWDETTRSCQRQPDLLFTVRSYNVHNENVCVTYDVRTCDNVTRTTKGMTVVTVSKCDWLKIQKNWIWRHIVSATEIVKWQPKHRPRTTLFQIW